MEKQIDKTLLNKLTTMRLKILEQKVDAAQKMLLLKHDLGSLEEDKPEPMDLMKTIALNNVILQQILMKQLAERPASSPDHSIQHERKRSTEKKLKHHSKHRHVKTKYPRLRIYVLAVIFTYILLKPFGKKIATTKAKTTTTSPAMLLKAGELDIATFISRTPEFIEWSKKLVDSSLKDLDLMGRKPVMKRATDFEIFKLATILDELIEVIARNVTMPQMKAGKVMIGLRMMHAIVSPDAVFPGGYLFDYESKYLSARETSGGPILPRRAAKPLLMTTLIARVLIKHVLLDPEKKNYIKAPKRSETLHRNLKVIAAVLYRAMRESLSSSVQTVEPSEYIIEEIRRAPPEDDDADIYNDEDLEIYVFQRVRRSLDEAEKILREWVDEFLDRIEEEIVLEEED